MTPKGVPDVALTSWHQTEEGNLVGLVEWSAAPGAVFRLELTSDGRLIEWRATANDGTSLSARQLRAAPVGAMERVLRRGAKGYGDHLTRAALDLTRLVEPGEFFAAEDTTLADLARIGASLSDFGARPRTGAAGRSDLSYATLSALYLQMIDEGQQRPIRAVADRLGLAEKTVQNHLFKARERGLLTSLGRGKAGGRLTDKAKEMLSGNDQAP